MIVKQADNKQSAIDELESLLGSAAPHLKPKIETELRNLKSGISGETNSSFFIDDNFKKSQFCYVIHDLRLAHEGRVAQIDHLLINRFLEVHVIETKNVHAGVKINEQGEFLRWNSFKKAYEGMPSPITQNERHIEILKNVFKDKIDVPSKLGIRLTPSYHSFILINPNARIDRPKKFNTQCVMKADDFFKNYDKDPDIGGILQVISSVAKTVSSEEVYIMAKQLVKLHQTLKTDYAAKFGLIKQTPVKEIVQQVVKQDTAKYSSFLCGKCHSEHLYVESGRFGYYFKCKKCAGNTAIKVNCSLDGHSVRLRKEGNRFYKECAECKTSALFYENASEKP